MRPKRGGTGNNGQIATITDNGDASKSMTYSYDALARLQYATAGPVATPTWKLGFIYDRYGNRTQQNLLAGTGFATQTPTNPVTNRLLSPNVYDASGNLTNDTLHTYTYDAENRITQVDGGTTATYTYDGGPLRVKKVAGGTTTVYIFSGTKVIAEYVNGAAPAQPTKEYVYAGRRLLATVAGGATTYQHPDHLSARVETDSAGTVARTFGHFPFGETWYETGTASKWKFTSYERDTESGLDQAVFRYDSSRLGRFMSPDPLAGSIFSPQSLNRYAYVQNDPVNFVDPLGLYISTGGPPPCEMTGTCGDEGDDGGGGGGGGPAGRHPPLQDTGPDRGGGGPQKTEKERQQECADQVVAILTARDGLSASITQQTVQVDNTGRIRVAFTFNSKVSQLLPSLDTFSKVGGGYRSNVGKRQPGLELNPSKTDPFSTSDINSKNPSDVDAHQFGGDVVSGAAHLIDVFGHMIGMAEKAACDILRDLTH